VIEIAVKWETEAEVMNIHYTWNLYMLLNT